jgi:hypothetical protein
MAVMPMPTTQKDESKPKYETPQIKQMSEREILSTFQVTQSMAGWWTTAGC